MVFNKLLREYRTKGFEKKKQRTTKLAKWAYFVKDREGLLSFGFDAVYLYFVEGNVSLEHMNDFLRRYEQIYDDEGFDGKDTAIFAYSGNFNTREFRSLAKKVLTNDQYKRMELKKISLTNNIRKYKKLSPARPVKIPLKPDVKKEEIIIPFINEFTNMVLIVNKWTPSKKHRYEEGYQMDLKSYLEYKHGCHVRLEALESKTDLLVNNNFPIEIKKNPNKSEYDRLVGQILRYYKAKENAIAVICDVKSKQLFDDFKNSITNLFPNNVEIIQK